MRVILRERDRAAGAAEGPPGCHLDRRLAGEVRDEEVHGQVLAVHEVVDHVPDGGVHDVGVDVAVVLVVEGGAGQHHAQLAAVVAVVVPALVLRVPGVEPRLD